MKFPNFRQVPYPDHGPACLIILRFYEFRRSPRTGRDGPRRAPFPSPAGLRARKPTGNDMEAERINQIEGLIEDLGQRLAELRRYL